MSIPSPNARRSETVAELVSALEAIEAILGGATGTLGAKQIASVERRLGVALPPIVRAFHATCGADERLFRPGWAGARILEASLLRVENGVLVVVDTPAPPRGAAGEEDGVKLGGPRQAPIARSALTSVGPLGRGAFLQRASPTDEWRGPVLGLATRLRELATFAALVTMRHVFTGPIRLRSREAKARLRETLERVGADTGARTFVDRELGVIVRNDHLMDRVTVGAPTERAIATLAERLGARLEPRVVRRARAKTRS